MSKKTNYSSLIILICLSIALILLFFLHLWLAPTLPVQPFSSIEGMKNSVWLLMKNTLAWVTALGFLLSWIIYALRHHVIAVFIAIIPLIQWVYFFFLYLSY